MMSMKLEMKKLKIKIYQVLILILINNIKILFILIKINKLIMIDKNKYKNSKLLLKDFKMVISLIYI